MLVSKLNLSISIVWKESRDLQVFQLGEFKLQPETDNYIHSKMLCIPLTKRFKNEALKNDDLKRYQRKGLPFRYFCGFNSNSVLSVVVISNWAPCGTITLIDYLWFLFRYRKLPCFSVFYSDIMIFTRFWVVTNCLETSWEMRNQ